MESFLGIPVGLALSTAAGLRVFIPLLLTGLAARLGYLKLAPGMTWIGSDAAVLAFATATVLEVGAYYVPWLDNLLDAVATPAAITAGVIATAAVTPELSPLLRWTTFTAGVGNPVVATGELAGSLALSLLGLLAPLLAGAVVVVVLALLARRLVGLLRERPRATPASGSVR